MRTSGAGESLSDAVPGGRRHLDLHHHGHEDLGDELELDPVEARRRHSEDRHVVPVQDQRLPHDAREGPKVAFETGRSFSPAEPPKTMGYATLVT
jgi:hypothetical protein